VNVISGNRIVGAGPTPAIAQNAIQISRGAAAAVTGNTVSENDYSPTTNVSTGILIVNSIGAVTVAQNRFVGNDVGIYAFSGATGPLVVRANTVTGGTYSIIVDDSSGVLVDNNTVVGAATYGLYATAGAKGNTFRDNSARGVTGEDNYDCIDQSEGTATLGTANTWTGDFGDTALPDGICSPGPIAVDVPPVIVLPLEPGTAPPKPAGPAGTAVGNQIVARMHQNQLRSCLISVYWVGPGRVLVARGFARAPARGGGRLIVRLGVRPKGKTLLSKHFGGVVVDVRALCRSSSGAHRRVKHARAVLLIEHVVTPPGSWVPDQPILNPLGVRFVHRLQQRMIAILAIRCDGYTATWIPSPADPPTLSMQRATVVCGLLKRAGVTVRPRLYAHGRSNPIATNDTEAGRRENRRVAVTFVHRLVGRS
jgi:parallel beta-helix repeat protein